MRIVITGSSGLIGQALSAALLAADHGVVRLVRHAPRGPLPDGSVEFGWDPAAGQLDPAALDGADAVVHLAGAGVGDHRWTSSYKAQIKDSRVLGTRTVAAAIAAAEKPPQVFVSGSAIGYYGATGAQAVDESAPAGTDFLARVCVEWEAAAAPAREAGVRVVHPRTGVVVAGEGGAFGRLLPLAKLGLGGRLGSGRQYWSFISLTDVVAALRHLIDTQSLEGPVNLTAPEPATNREITIALGQALHRPMLLPVPAPALKLVIGEFSDGILMSQRVLPTALLESGFGFTHLSAESAVRQAVEDSASAR
jgi:uncharacterized protein